jgi:hypothetical protein
MSALPFTRDHPGSPITSPVASFSRARRFFNSQNDSPGPIYRPPTTEHVASPRYSLASPTRSSTSHSPRSLPNPSRDRSAWILGAAVKGDLSSYADIADSQGPNTLIRLEAVLKQSPRVKFLSEPRFKGNQLLNVESPGPQYYPKYCLQELKSPRSPAYSFSGDKIGSNRSLFLHSTIQSGKSAHYNGRPDTADRNVDAGPNSYEVKLDAVLPASPRVSFSKERRFQPSTFRYLGKKLDQHGNLHSLASPGPIYYIQNFDVGFQVKNKKFPNVNAKGNWCP